MYTWRIPEKPDTTTSGLIHVDENDAVWQWTRDSETDPRMSKWVRKADWYLEEVAQARLYLSAAEIDRPIFGKAISIPINEWDDLYSKAFIRFEHTPEVSSGPITAHHKVGMSKKEAEDFLAANMPKNGAYYQGILVVKFYQVIDPSIKCFRTGHSNEMYSLIRGGHAHNRNSGRLNYGLQEFAGLSEKFHNSRWNDTWHVDTGKKFLNEFFGITTAPGGDLGKNIFFFSRGARNFYKQPKAGTAFSAKDRWWYNVTSNSYVDLSGQGNIGATIGVPRLFTWNPEITPYPRQLLPMRSTRGGDFFAKNIRGVVIYPLTGTYLSQQIRAFLVRPYGMDIVGLGCSREIAKDPNWQVVAENIYPDAFTKAHRVVDSMWAVYDSDLITFRISRAIKIRGGGKSYRLEHSGIPEKVYFYLQNANTGVRSEKFQSSIQIVRRRNNMTVGVLPSHR